MMQVIRITQARFVSARVYTKHKEIKYTNSKTIHFCPFFSVHIQGICKCKLHVIAPFLHGKDTMRVEKRI